MVGNENAAAVRYRIDPSRSQFTVKAFAEGLLSAFGHDPVIAVCGFGGNVQFVPGTLERGSVLMLVSADSLKAIGAGSEKDHAEIERAIREEVLEIARYPEIVFLSTDVAAQSMTEGAYRVKLNGELSLHGVKRRVPIDAQVTVNGESLRAQGELTLRQSDYSIKPVSVMGGTLKVKDEVKLSFDIEAHR